MHSIKLLQLSSEKQTEMPQNHSYRETWFSKSPRQTEIGLISKDVQEIGGKNTAFDWRHELSLKLLAVCTRKQDSPAFIMVNKL